MRTVFTGIKKIIGVAAAVVFWALFALMCSGLTACDNGGDNGDEKKIRVSITDSIFFEAEPNSVEISEGENPVFRLKMAEGFTVSACSHAYYDVQKDGGDCVITLYRVTRPTTVTVKSEKISVANTNGQTTCSVIYDLNDGTSPNKKIDYTLSYHIRPNTLSGENIARDGFTLIGWNTKKDGSGERIGLGSRVTVQNGGVITLYGEWAPWISADKFIAETLPDGSLALTGYTGESDIQPFTVPAKINGTAVSRISGSFTSDMPCGKLTAKTLVLPESLSFVADAAFANSAFDEIYFFDGLTEFGINAFNYGISTYHINANTPPRLQSNNYNVRFADTMDVLMTTDKKKLILFSGCSMAYGLDSTLIDKAVGGEYEVINAGINGEFDAHFQLQAMLPYISEGDVIIHAPEQMNPYQFLAENGVSGELFCMAEGNYDLIALADFSYTDRMLFAYKSYVNIRSTQEPCEYSDYSGDFNNYGDFIAKRDYDEANASAFDKNYGDWGFDFGLLTEDVIARLVEYYAKFEQKGAKVYFSWAPMNEQSNKNGDIYAAATDFQTRLAALFEPYGYKIISEVSDYIWKGRYFFDTDYHLNDYGAVLRTRQLIADLKAIGIGA